MATVKISIYYTNATDKGRRFFCSNRFPNTREEFLEGYVHMADLPVSFDAKAPSAFATACEDMFSMFQVHRLTDELAEAMRASQIENNVRHTSMAMGDVVIITTDEGSRAFAVDNIGFAELTQQIL